MNSIYMNPTMVLSTNSRSTPTPPPHIQPFVTSAGISTNRYLPGPTFLIRHSPANNYQQHSNHLQFQRPHPQMRLQYINMAPSNNGFIGYPLRKSYSSTNLQFNQVHHIKSGMFLLFQSSALINLKCFLLQQTLY